MKKIPSIHRPDALQPTTLAEDSSVVSAATVAAWAVRQVYSLLHKPSLMHQCLSTCEYRMPIIHSINLYLALRRVVPRTLQMLPKFFWYIEEAPILCLCSLRPSAPCWKHAIFHICFLFFIILWESWFLSIPLAQQLTTQYPRYTHFILDAWMFSAIYEWADLGDHLPFKNSCEFPFWVGCYVNANL